MLLPLASYLDNCLFSSRLGTGVRMGGFPPSIGGYRVSRALQPPITENIPTFLIFTRRSTSYGGCLKVMTCPPLPRPFCLAFLFLLSGHLACTPCSKCQKVALFQHFCFSLSLQTARSQCLPCHGSRPPLRLSKIRRILSHHKLLVCHCQRNQPRSTHTEKLIRNGTLGPSEEFRRCAWFNSILRQRALVLRLIALRASRWPTTQKTFRFLIRTFRCVLGFWARTCIPGTWKLSSSPSARKPNKKLLPMAGLLVCPQGSIRKT